jgi:hypothetical protein
MQWWIRPGTRRCCAIRKTSPSLPRSARAEPHVSAAVLGVAAEHAELLYGCSMLATSRTRLTRRVDGDEEHRGPLVRRSVGIGDRHHDEDVGDRAVRGEPLVPVEDVAVAVAHGACAQLRRVRARRLRLGHRERGLELTGEERVEPALLLLGRAGSDDSLLPESGAWHPNTAARRSTCRDLVHQPELDLSEPPPSSGGAPPTAPLLHPLLERRADPAAG